MTGKDKAGHTATEEIEISAGDILQWVFIGICVVWLTILTVIVIDTAEYTTMIMKVVGDLHK